MAARYRNYAFDTSSVAGSADALSAAVSSTAGTITLTSGTATVTGTQIQIGTENMLILAGGGTATLQVLRGFAGTTAASHSSGATVSVPGALVYNLIQVANAPNQEFTYTKTSTDINYVKLVPASGDSFQSGASAVLLADTSSQYGTAKLLAMTVGSTWVTTQLGTVSASQLTGIIQAGQINSITASQITGVIDASQINTITASQITGTILASQINTIAATQITGSITSSQIGSVSATSISGSITSGQISSVAATTITGVIVSSQLVSDIINSANLIDGSILANGLTKTGTQVGISPSGMTSGSWTASQIASVSASTLVGLIVAGQIQSIATSQLTGQITSTQISSVAALSITGTISSSQIGSVNASTITGTLSSAQIGSINAATITIGLIGSSQISSINASQLNAGTINVGSGGMTFSGAGGIIVASGGSISVTPGNVSAQNLEAVGNVICNSLGIGGGFYVGSTQVINSSGAFIGTGVNVSGGVGGTGFNPFVGGVQYFGATFTFQDLAGTTHTVKGGVLVS